MIVYILNGIGALFWYGYVCNNGLAGCTQQCHRSNYKQNKRLYYQQAYCETRAVAMLISNTKRNIEKLLTRNKPKYTKTLML